MFKPSAAPRMKIATSVFWFLPSDAAARASHIGACAIAAIAIAEPRRKMRLVNMAIYLLWKSGEPNTSEATTVGEAFLPSSPAAIVSNVCREASRPKSAFAIDALSAPCHRDMSTETPGRSPDATAAPKFILAIADVAPSQVSATSG
jgi:hypothetical protein